MTDEQKSDKCDVKRRRNRLWKNSLFLALLVSFACLSAWLSRSDAVHILITTTDIDDCQYQIPYSFVMTTNDTHAITERTWSATGLPTGLSINATTGVISGTPTGPPGTYAVGVTLSITPALTDHFAFKGFSMRLVGRLDMDSGILKPGFVGQTDVGQAIDSGANNVAVWQFVLRANGEDIRLNQLTFYGLGQGSDTFDIERAELFVDVNSNGQVDSPDVFLPTAQAFVKTTGFNPTVTFTNIGYILDSHLDNGTETFLVSYDFKSTVEAGRTFRLAMEGSGDISWTTIGTNVTNGSTLSGGDLNSQGRSVQTGWSQNRIYPASGPPSLSLGLPFKSAIITIKGPTPTQATLNVSAGTFAPALVNVSAGAVTQAAMGIRFWTDSYHTIIVNSISLDDSGTGIADSHLTEAKLFYDLDASGTFSANDLLLRSGSFVQDRVTFSNLNLLVRTPSGLPTDASAVNLLVTYSFSTNIPVLNPPLTFEPRFNPSSGINAQENVAGTPVAIGGVALSGNVFSVVAGTLSTLTVDTGAFLQYHPDSTISVANNDTRVVVWGGRFFADSGHAISLNALRFTASGNLDDRFDVTSVSLVKDRDNTGTFTSGDVTLASGTYAADNDTIILTLSIPEIIRTPNGTGSDSNSLKLLLVYSLNGNAPVVIPDSISFSAKLLSTNDVFAKVYNAGESISFV
ncbi:MAG: Ig domain-containing protein, partial [Candidatus Hydrogenedentota bacterium]